MTQKANGEAGLTLMELMVVVGIIAILASLLLPGIHRAKASAQKTTCLNNLRQINEAILMYADDSHGTLPGLITNIPSPWLAYKELMKSYVAIQGPSSERDKIFACPADTFYYPGFWDARIPQSHYKQAYYDYSSYAFSAGNYHSNFAGVAGVRVSSIHDPVKTLLVLEAPALWPYSWHRPSREPQYINDSHFNNARGVVSFVDGHVNYIKMFLDTRNVVIRHEEAWHYNPPLEYGYKWNPD